MKPKFTRYLASVVLVFSSVQVFSSHAQASCDGCVTAAVTSSGTATTSAIASMQAALVFQLENIGNALASINTANIGMLEKLSEVNHQGMKAMVRETHELTTKKAALDIKTDLNKSFAARSLDYCMEAETALGVVNTYDAPYQKILSHSKAFSEKIRENTKSPALRRRIMSEYLPLDQDYSEYFSANKTLQVEQLEHIPIVAHVLAQNTVFPIAPSFNSDKENDRSRHYRELRRERDVHGAIAEDALTRAMLINAPIIDAGDFARFSFEKAGIDANDYVRNEKTSEASLIKAIGVSNFGSATGIHNAAISGDELLRLAINELGKTNFVLAKQYEALKDIRFLSALSYSKQVETFFNDKLEHAYQKLN